MSPVLHMLIMPYAAGQCRGDAKTRGMLKIRTLNQLHDACEDQVLLALSLPLGVSGVVDTPRLRFVVIIYQVMFYANL